jgi:hypothetical protein
MNNVWGLYLSRKSTSKSKRISSLHIFFRACEEVSVLVMLYAITIIKFYDPAYVLTKEAFYKASTGDISLSSMLDSHSSTPGVHLIFRYVWDERF